MSFDLNKLETDLNSLKEELSKLISDIGVIKSANIIGIDKSYTSQLKNLDHDYSYETMIKYYKILKENNNEQKKY